MAQFLRWAQEYYDQRECSHFIAVAKILRQHAGSTAADDFGPKRLKIARQAMVEQGWARKYVNRQVTRVRQVFNWGVSEEIIPATNVEALRAVKGLRVGRSNAKELPQIRPVAVETVDATLEELPAIVADMARLQLLTGMRPGEPVILRPQDLDRSGEIWAYRPYFHKTGHHGHDRVIMLGPRAQAILLRYLARGKDDYCFRPCDSEAKRYAQRHAERKTPLYSGNRPGANRVKKRRHPPGQQYTVASFRRAIHNACDRAFPHPVLASIPRSQLSARQLGELKSWQSEHRWSPNQLRHTAATQIRKRYGLDTAQAVLGHSEANVTQIYAELDAKKAEMVARELG